MLLRFHEEVVSPRRRAFDDDELVAVPIVHGVIPAGEEPGSREQARHRPASVFDSSLISLRRVQRFDADPNGREDSEDPNVGCRNRSMSFKGMSPPPFGEDAQDLTAI